jgi:hypothetical protein
MGLFQIGTGAAGAAFRLAIDAAHRYIGGMSKVTSKRTLPRWRITRIKGTPAVELATGEALDADAAIRVAIEQFEITNPEYQRRLAARRLE